jgi:S-(hydroxymethyl)glutathione dehydrogenase/alcohol dehydrogenase
MKTLADVLTEINKPLTLMELELPQLGNGQVLVNISYSGICHTQLNEMKGKKGPDKYLPHTLGHEGSGIVESIGPGVKKVKPGDHVVLTWIKGKGLDVPSTKYIKQDGSFVNSGAIATFLTKAIISENRIVKINKKMPLKEAALLGCAIPTGAGIALNTANIIPGSSVAIFGVGGVGISALIGSRLMGAKTLITIDVQAHKLDHAKQFGATHIINAANEDVLKQIKNITNDKGVDYAIEASGIKTAMETAFMSVKDKGGLCVLAGNLPQNEKISIDPFDLIKGKRIIGTWGGETDPDRDIPKYVRFVLSGKLKLEKMLTHEYMLKEINSAFTALEKGDVGRAIVQM